MSVPIFIEWTRDAAKLEEIAKFFARVIALDPSYISHGEIQAALSLDGATWRPDLEKHFIEAMGRIDIRRSVVLARNGAYDLVGASIVRWDHEPAETAFTTIEDLAVEPEKRQNGVGAALLGAIVDESRVKGMRWIILESGKRNQTAHEFFENHSFDLISHVFARRL
jgi:GNAT superfamily N-acetyltransferase